MCHMIVDCCGQNRTYEKFFGLTATRLCMLKREYMELFELIFVEQYETIHRLETNKLRNVGKVINMLGGRIKRLQLKEISFHVCQIYSPCSQISL